MEEFVGNIPTDWTATIVSPLFGVFRIDVPANVHTGISSVGMKNDTTLSQIVAPIKESCHYQFSFFARADVSEASLTATAVFLTTDGGEIPAASIVIREGSMVSAEGVFGYYRAITERAPEDAVQVRITFRVTAPGISYVYIDDVSLSGL